MIRDTAASSEGFVERAGVKVNYQVFGNGERTLVLMPTWSIVHSDFWRRQVPHLMKTHRVVVFDGRGNGASDRPPTADAYADDEFAADALAVMDAAGVERAVVAISSMTRGEQLAELTGGKLVVMPDAGHEPQSRWPEDVTGCSTNSCSRRRRQCD